MQATEDKLRKSNLMKLAKKIEDTELRKSVISHINKSFTHIGSSDMYLGNIEDFLWIERAKSIN